MCHARALFARKFETEGRLLDGCWKDRFLLHMHVSTVKKIGWMEQLTSHARFGDVLVLLDHVHDCLSIVQATIQCFDMQQARCKT